MSWKWYALGLLCMATVTACTHPMDRALETRSAYHQQGIEYSGKISAGACDDLGQLIPGENSGVTLEANAAPTR